MEAATATTRWNAAFSLTHSMHSMDEAPNGQNPSGADRMVPPSMTLVDINASLLLRQPCVPQRGGILPSVYVYLHHSSHFSAYLPQCHALCSMQIQLRNKR